MKVLFANKFFHLNGGSERVFFQERECLIDKGHKVIDFSMKDERNLPSPFSNHFVPNICFHNAEGILSNIKKGAAFVHSPVAVRNIKQLVKQEKPEIAHLHNIYHQLTPSIIPVLKNHGVKVVLTLHDSKLICPNYLALKDNEICTECCGRFFWKPLTTKCQGTHAQGLLLAAEAFFHKCRGSYDDVDLFISPSQFMSDLSSMRVPAEKIRVLNNGIDINEYQPASNDEGYGLYFGRLSKEKGIETLLQAYRMVNGTFPLKIIGKGPLEEKLRMSYADAEFLGYKTGDELKSFVANAGFVVVPSECFENCSMVVLESMALGKPVIGSRIGGIPEQVEDGKSGLLFEMGNIPELAEKMKALSENPKIRIDMGKAARKKLEAEYSLSNHCDKLLDIYNELLA